MIITNFQTAENRAPNFKQWRMEDRKMENLISGGGKRRKNIVMLRKAYHIIV